MSRCLLLGQNGPFKSVDEIYQIKGLSPEMKAVVKKYEGNLVALEVAPEVSRHEQRSCACCGNPRVVSAVVQFLCSWADALLLGLNRLYYSSDYSSLTGWRVFAQYREDVFNNGLYR
jgi:hypothetical protein